jgi:hypothetical protein
MYELLRSFVGATGRYVKKELTIRLFTVDLRIKSTLDAATRGVEECR